jgi:hypothetical protein
MKTLEERINDTKTYARTALGVALTSIVMICIFVIFVISTKGTEGKGMSLFFIGLFVVSFTAFIILHRRKGRPRKTLHSLNWLDNLHIRKPDRDEPDTKWSTWAKEEFKKHLTEYRAQCALLDVYLKMAYKDIAKGYDLNANTDLQEDILKIVTAVNVQAIAINQLPNRIAEEKTQALKEIEELIEETRIHKGTVKKLIATRMMGTEGILQSWNAFLTNTETFLTGMKASIEGKPGDPDAPRRFVKFNKASVIEGLKPMRDYTTTISQGASIIHHLAPSAFWRLQDVKLRIEKLMKSEEGKAKDAQGRNSSDHHEALLEQEDELRSILYAPDLSKEDRASSFEEIKELYDTALYTIQTAEKYCDERENPTAKEGKDQPPKEQAS